MDGYNFYHTIEVRYGDLDPQGHVNNANYFTYLEQARVAYITHLGLWDGHSFFDIGFILADAHLTFKAPILFGTNVRIWVRVSQLGTKSLTMDYRMEDAGEGYEYATGEAVLVTYNYYNGETIIIPDEWRLVIAEFEGMSHKYNLNL
ncbi:acyl-CoA thioesterase [Chloroflexota bacterium]